MTNAERTKLESTLRKHLHGALVDGVLLCCRSYRSMRKGTEFSGDEIIETIEAAATELVNEEVGKL